MQTKFDMRGALTFILSLAMFVSPMIASAATVVAKPGPFPIGMDTWYGSYYNTSSQHDGSMHIGGWGDEYDSLVRFDLSGLPLTATQAVVWLYAYPSGLTPVNINWYQNTTQWHTGSVSWSTRPSGNYLGYTNAPSTIPGWYGVIFTSLYNSWRSGNISTPNYGLALKPTANNNVLDTFYGSGYGTALYRPEFDITYNTSGTDSIPKFKWPLAAPAYANRTVSQAFGAFPWSGGTICPTGYQKYHNGTDYPASAGTAEYAPEDGVVKESLYDPNWGYNVVMEHNSPSGAKYTSVIWHIQPNVDVVASNPGGFIPKGAPLGVVYNLGSNSHMHLGVRMSPYSSPDSGAGALPQTNCGGYQAFPANFVNVENSNNVIFSN